MEGNNMRLRGFEVVSKYEGEDLLPQRSTKKSAGYDLKAAEDYIIPSMLNSFMDLFMSDLTDTVMDLDTIKAWLKEHTGFKPTLVSTGVKAYMQDNEWLGVYSRSGIPLNSLLIVGNSIGVVDSDYYNNPSNEGEMFVQFINLSPFPIKIRKGERIAQGIFHTFGKVDNDNATGERLGGHSSTGVK